MLRPLLLATALGLTLSAPAAARDGTAMAPPSAAEPIIENAIVAGADGLPALFDCLRGKTTLISAHRGGVEPGFPENAIETIENTLAQAPMLAEIDVVTSRDGVPFLLHDDVLARTTTGTGNVVDTDWADIRDLRLKDNDGVETAFPPPSLSVALAWARGRTVLLLDIKRSSDPEAIARQVLAEDAKAHAVLIVYSVDAAAKVHAIDPELMLSVSIDERDDFARLEDAGVNLDAVLAWKGIQNLQPDLVMELDQRGISASFGTLWYTDGEIMEAGDDSVYARIGALGIDVMATDRHHEAYAAMQENGSTEAALATCSAQ